MTRKCNSLQLCFLFFLIIKNKKLAGFMDEKKNFPAFKKSSSFIFPHILNLEELYNYLTEIFKL